MNQKNQLKRKKRRKKNIGGNSIPIFGNNTKCLSHTRSHIRGVLNFEKGVSKVLVCYKLSMVLER